MNKRRLCIITGSRADWGLFYPLAKKIKRERGDFVLQIIAAGAHLSFDAGRTYREIERDGFKIDRKVRMVLPGDTEEIIAKSVSLGIAGIVKALESLRPDLAFLLGDRFEIFSAAVATLFLKIPIAHIHGGELTEGSLDDSLRHAITKMSTFHFVSTDTYRKRVIQMGEDPRRVFNVGALGLDNIRNANLLSKKSFEERINFKLGPKNIMVTFSPSTSEEKGVSERQFKDLLKTLNELPEARIIFTRPNPDMYSEAIIRLIDEYVSKNRDRAVSFTSMGRELYLSALRFADVVAGNSSSGIIEAPSFGMPTINIGSREEGRIKADSVIDVDGGARSLRGAFKRAFSEDFRKLCRGVKNPYGDGRAAGRIVDIVKRIECASSKKRFYDIHI